MPPSATGALRSNSTAGKRPRQSAAAEKPTAQEPAKNPFATAAKAGRTAASSTASAGTSGISAENEDVQSTSDIRWHFCDPNKKPERKNKRTDAAPQQRSGEHKSQQQIAKVLDLMNRGKKRVAGTDAAARLPARRYVRTAAARA